MGVRNRCCHRRLKTHAAKQIFSAFFRCMPSFIRQSLRALSLYGILLLLSASSTRCVRWDSKSESVESSLHDNLIRQFLWMLPLPGILLLFDELKSTVTICSSNSRPDRNRGVLHAFDFASTSSTSLPWHIFPPPRRKPGSSNVHPTKNLHASFFSEATCHALEPLL